MPIGPVWMPIGFSVYAYWPHMCGCLWAPVWIHIRGAHVLLRLPSKMLHPPA